MMTMTEPSISAQISPARRALFLRKSNHSLAALVRDDDLNKADIRPSEASKVTQLVEYLKQNPAFHVELEGFADPCGSQADNVKPSTQRVHAVRDALIAAGVPAEQIVVGAYGKLNTKCAAKGEECWQQDRRVEVIVLPTGTATSLRTGNGK
jgi:hypothetical protein